MAMIINIVGVAAIATTLLAVILGRPADAGAYPPQHPDLRVIPNGHSFGTVTPADAASRAPPRVPYHPDAKQPPTPGTGEIIKTGGTKFETTD